MLVAMVDKSEVCNPRLAEFYDLEFFENRDDLIQYVARETKRGYYVRDVWHTITQHKLPLNIEYHCVETYISHVTLHNNGKLVYTVKPDPEDHIRRWVVIKELDNDNNRI